MRKKYFTYRGKYSGTYRIASAEDAQPIHALLSDGWTQTTLADVRDMRKRAAVVNGVASAYIDATGALVIVEPD